MVYEPFNQIAVHNQAGLTFASALRNVLRQDPDIIMVGEIRDRETAEYAIQAALTGHLVFSTLHTNTASGAITRLRDLGIEPFLLASTLLAVIAQRLLRNVCKACDVPAEISAESKRLIGVDKPGIDQTGYRKGEGCESCRNTGYSGRTAIMETPRSNRDNPDAHKRRRRRSADRKCFSQSRNTAAHGKRRAKPARRENNHGGDLPRGSVDRIDAQEIKKGPTVESAGPFSNSFQRTAWPILPNDPLCR